MPTLPNKFRPRAGRSAIATAKGAAPVNRLNGSANGATGPAPEMMARESLAGGTFGNGGGGYGGGSFGGFAGGGFTGGWVLLGTQAAALNGKAGEFAALVALARNADNLTRVFGPGVYADMARDPACSSSLNLLKQGMMAGGITLSPVEQPDADKDLAPAPTLAPATASDQSDGSTATVAPPAPDPEEEARKAKVALAKEITELCQFALDGLTGLSIDDFCLAMLDGLDVGVKLGEVTYRPVTRGRWAGKWTLASLKPKSGEAWAFVVDCFGNVAGYLATVSLYGMAPSWRQQATGNSLTGSVATTDGGGSTADVAATLGGYDFLPVDKCAVFSWMPRDGDPRGRSILEPAHSAWSYKIAIMSFWYEYLTLFARAKVLASPGEESMMVMGTDEYGNPTPGTQVDTYTALQTTLNALANLSYAVLPPGSTVNLLEPKGEGAAFANFVDWADRQIALAILQSTRATMEAQNGSKADSEGGQDNVGLTVRVGRHTLVKMVRDVLRNLVRANYGDDAADELTPLVSLGTTEHQDQAALIAALSPAGYKLDESQFARIDQKVNLPVRTVLTPEQAADKAAIAMKASQDAMARHGVQPPPAPGASGQPGGTADGSAKGGRGDGKPGGAVAGKVGQAAPKAKADVAA